MSHRGPSRAAGEAGTSASGPRELAEALVRGEGSLPSNLQPAVINALAELLELAGTLQELPLEGVNPMLWPDRWK